MPFYRSPFFLPPAQQWTLALIFILLISVFYIRQQIKEQPDAILNEEALLASQKLWDSLQLVRFQQQAKISPLNFNYLSEYQAYTLGIPIAAYDLLQSHKAKGGFVSSLKEFQQITNLSDSMVQELKPYFRKTTSKKQGNKKRISLIRKDLNQATQKELEKIYGIGAVLAARIIKYRAFLGGFSLLDQCNEVYGLEPSVVEALSQQFEIASPPTFKKRAINKANLDELQKTPYISRASAKKIIAFRTAEGTISVDDLTKVLDDSLNKIERIKLYLY
ncbi:MAG: helix-hairpin-helix domain-containing protein [Flavobacteriaceae bacterium]|jgi:DNA uptake protein ComE-like DNA-binding protein